MTLTQAREELYGLLSKNSELDPATVAGQALLDQYLNRAYKQVLAWRTARGRLRFPAAYASTTLQALVLTGDVASATSTTAVLSPTGLSGTDDAYLEYVLGISAGTGEGQKRVVVDYDGASYTCTVNRAWDTTPDATSDFFLSKRWVVPASDFRGVLKLTDLEDLRDLELGEQTENYSGSLEEVGSPTSFFVYSGRIYLNNAPEESRWYRLEYERAVPDLTGAGESFDVPTPWEGLVVLMARWWLLVRYGETEDAYSAKRDYQEMAQSLAQSGEDLGQRTDGGTSRLF